jgi:hypothetical protein
MAHEGLAPVQPLGWGRAQGGRRLGSWGVDVDVDDGGR